MHKLTVFFDGECPLCRREIAWLSKRTKEVDFIDISLPSFSATAFGYTQEGLMSEIHAQLGEQKLVGMDVFRELYNRCGLGWLAAPTAIWPLRPIFDWLYRVFARNRLKLTGRCGSKDCSPD
jgi:predicted DCC family thiol-disulfide oxidoreductase YuxK